MFAFPWRPLLRFLDVDEERLEFRRLGVGISHVGCERIADVAVLRHADETPVNRNADGMHFLAIDIERLDPARDDCDRNSRPALSRQT